MATTRTPRNEEAPSGEPGSRRRLVAETALHVLAEQGARGLTHRAVDERAALPAGSTSYYFRTRDELVSAAATCLCEADEKDVVEASKRGGVPWLLARWSSRRHRHRLIARFELFLEATRNEKTRRMIRKQRAGFLVATRRSLEVAGVEDAALRAELLVAQVDGLLLAQAVQPSASFTALQRSVARALVGKPRGLVPLRS